MENGQRDGSILLFMAVFPSGEAMGKGPRKLLVVQSRVEMETAHHSWAVPGLLMDAMAKHSWLLQKVISTWQNLHPH